MRSPVLRLFGTVGVLLFLLTACGDGTGDDWRSATFSRLEAARAERKSAIASLLDDVLATTQQAAFDQTLVHFFKTFRSGDKVKDRFIVSADSLALDRHYVEKYGVFYDILFIDRSGLIFHTIKLESDYRRNIFRGSLATTTLARNLKATREVRFVDYDYYDPSREAASFFVVPVRLQEKHAGWIVFQFSVNALNSILVDYEGLGRTGEVYLTNARKMMLSQSRFVPDNTVLTLEVNTAAVRTALQQDTGNLAIRDYRGVQVFSSFEKLSFAGATWIIVAEIDEDEILTDFLSANLDTVLDPLLEALPATEKARSDPSMAALARVDINEFAKAGPGEGLITHGLATCTGVSVRHAGRFAYLGHVFPLDAAYHSSWGYQLLQLGGRLTGQSQRLGKADLLGRMLRRITIFDVVPFERRNLEITLAAVHRNGFRHMVQRLLAQVFSPHRSGCFTIPRPTSRPWSSPGCLTRPMFSGTAPTTFIGRRTRRRRPWENW